MKKKAEVVTMETTSEVCSLVTLISFYTTRTFNHETTRTQLQLNPVGILLASAPSLQTVLWSRAEPRLLWGSPSSKSNGYSGLLASKVPARWVSGGDLWGWTGKCKSGFQQRTPSPWPVLSSVLPHSCSHRPDLLCAGKCHFSFAPATWITESLT